MQDALQKNRHGKYLPRQGLEGQIMAVKRDAVNEKALARRVKDHVQGKSHDFFAVVQPGFEETAIRELSGLGIADIKSCPPGGIEFQAKLDDACRVNLGAGTVSRLLLRLLNFKATGFAEFGQKIAAVPWELHLANRTRIKFVISTGRSRLWHQGRLLVEAQKAVALRLGDYGRQAVFTEKTESGPAAEQLIFLRFDQNRCQVSLDSSGELLYRRGYGKFVEQAPLRETLACCILHAAASERYQVLLDPFSGSGTFSVEAGLIFSGRPCNSNRDFAFQNWPAFRPAHYRHLKDGLEVEMKSRVPAGPKQIFCSDISEKAAATARRNLELAGLDSLAQVGQADFFRLRPPAADPAGVLLVLNPPYGTRLGRSTDIAGLYRRIGDKIRRDFSGCGYAVIVPGLELEKALSLPHEQKILFRNGGIPVSLLIHQSKIKNP
jgi:putative N6-adenine-specific DNA methylase